MPRTDAKNYDFNIREASGMTDSISKSTVMWIGGIVFGAITTTATGMHILYDQFVIPLKVFKSTQKVEELTAQLKSQTSAILELNNTKEKLEKAQQKLEQIELSDLFLKGDPFPSTIETIKLGQPISKVNDLYEKDQLKWSNESEGNFSVRANIDNSVFRYLLYSYNEKTKKIESILFRLNYEKELSKDFLQIALSRALGIPETSRKKGQIKWQVSGIGSVYIIVDDSYLIMESKYVPAVWAGSK
jgi:hypothetical protein